MRMIGCTSPLTAGSLDVLGFDVTTNGRRIRERIGVVPQQDPARRRADRHRNLVIYGRYFDIARRECHARAARLLEFVQLGDRAASAVEPLSGGMKRRLTIARGLINDPELLILDEPTTGLDPQARHVVWERLYRLKQQGVTLVITTHYMDEAEQLCDTLVVMDHGRIVAEGAPLELITRYSTREVLEVRFASDGRARRLRRRCHRQLGRRQHVAVRQRPHRHARRADRWHRPRNEWLPDRVLIYTDDGEAALGELHPAAPRWSARWCAAAASKTSSCTSPAAPWSTDGTHRRARRPDHLQPAVASCDDRVVVAWAISAAAQ